MQAKSGILVTIRFRLIYKSKSILIFHFITELYL